MAPQDTILPTAWHWGTYVARIRDGAVEIEAHPSDPDPCPIGYSMADTARSAARVSQPMVRKGFLERGPRHDDNRRGAEPFVPVSWDEATKLVADTLQSVKARFGNEAIYGGAYGWSSAGRFHHSQGQLHRFLNLFGGYVDHSDSYSWAALGVIMPHILGDTLRVRADLPTWQAIAKDTQLFVAFGGVPLRNTQVNPGGLLRHSVRDDMKAARDAGVAFVVISPSRDDMAAELGAQWINIRPHTDVAFMLALAHVMIAENCHDQDFVNRCCVGFDTLRDYVLGVADGVPKTPAWAAAICDCTAEEIASLARRMTEKRTLVSLLWAIQRADHGEQPCWMAAALASLAGSMGKPGGGVGFGYGSVHGYGTAASRFKAAAFPQGENAVKTFFPVARLADVLLNPGAPMPYNGRTLTNPDIRLIYWVGGNTFHHHQDINKLLRAWQRPEAIIVHEPFWTATARHADIVLPATTPLERDDIAFGDGSFIATHKILDPVGEARSDYTIFADIAAQLGFHEAFTEGRTEADWLSHLYETTRARAKDSGIDLPDYAGFRRAGVIELPTAPPPPAMFGAFRDDPAGHPLRTASGKVHLASEEIARFGYDDCPGHPTWMEPTEWLGSPRTADYPIHMLSSQPATRLHSQYDNGAFSLASKIQGREPLAMNPHDAAARGIAEGDVIRVFNDRGAFLAGARLNDGLRRGVAQIATGAWYDPVEPGTPGTLDVHGNPNMVTPDRPTSQMAQGPSAQSALVQIEKFTGTLPPIRCFTPPETVGPG